MIGDHVYLGSLEQDGDKKNGKEPISWTVIDLDNNYCILITDRIIGHQAYESSADSNTNWTNSNIRSWLSTKLFSDIFNEVEQDAIVSVKTDESGEFINSYEAADKIFLLSKEQAEHYMLNNEARVIPSETPDYSLEKDAYHREAWWLRTSYGTTKKRNIAIGVAVGAQKNTERMESALGIRPVVVVKKAEINVRPFQLPERDEYKYLIKRVINETAPMQCLDKLIEKTTEYLSAHYNKAVRTKMKRSSHYYYHIVNTTTGEVLSYDDKPNYFSPSSYTISTERDVNRFLQGSYEEIEMSTATSGFFN